jgi:hypothetical protein
MVDRGTPPREVDERTIAHLVRGLAQATAPDAPARDRMRQRILTGLAEHDSAALALRQRADSVDTAHPPPTRGSRAPRNRPDGADRGSRRPGDLPRSGTGARGRFAIAAVAALALVLSLAGMSLLLARDALPGDALYGIKRTAETASLGLTFGDEPKALKHLEFAAARVNEIETLAQRYPNPADAPVGGYLTALSDFDNDAAAGSRQLIALATRNDGRQLESLREWARQQANRLDAVSARLPAAARNREGATLALLSKIAQRSDALLGRMQCYQITTGSFDDIGALPATGQCERIPGAPPAAPAPGASVDPRTPLPGQSLNTPAQPPQPQPQQPTAQLPGQTLPPLLPTVPGLPTTTAPGAPPASGAPQPPVVVPLPVPLPTIELPPLLPGVPGVRIGG